jgi:hypothetical protein
MKLLPLSGQNVYSISQAIQQGLYLVELPENGNVIARRKVPVI